MGHQNNHPLALNLSIHKRSKGVVQPKTQTFREATTQLLSCSKKTSRIATKWQMTSSEQSGKALRFLSYELRLTQWNCQRPIMAHLWVSTSVIRVPCLEQLPLQLNKSAWNKWSYVDSLAKKQAGTTISSPFPSTTPLFILQWGFLSSKSEPLLKLKQYLFALYTNKKPKVQITSQTQIRKTEI